VPRFHPCGICGLRLQGYAGIVTECSACHLRSLPVSDKGGPHGLHTVGSIWVSTHTRAAKADPEACTVCHGKDYMGTKLSKTPVARRFRVAGRGIVAYVKGQEVGCYECHNGPSGMR